ncbi:hypothetical protein ID866_3051 [Astraeus odoratus]|nr:hypothetical protein ID866_3051 [Astraeus odoratus]
MLKVRKWHVHHIARRSELRSGRTQLATELTVSAEEFDVYDVFPTPITIAFHLREFNATIGYAEAMGLALDLRFTDPAAPLFIVVEGDESESLFVISTSQMQNAPPNTHDANGPVNPSSSADTRMSARKRAHPDVPVENQQSLHSAGSRPHSETPRIERARKPMKAAHRTDATPATGSRDVTARSQTGPGADGSLDPSLLPVSQQNCPSNKVRPVTELAEGLAYIGDTTNDMGIEDHQVPIVSRETLFDACSQNVAMHLPSGSRPSSSFPPPLPPQTPLFFPLSQLSHDDEQLIRESGLGVEHMDEDELNAMLEGDAEEVEFTASTARRSGEKEVCSDGQDSLELFEDEFGPTQEEHHEGGKAFQALFED